MDLTADGSATPFSKNNESRLSFSPNLRTLDTDKIKMFIGQAIFNSLVKKNSQTTEIIKPNEIDNIQLRKPTVDFETYSVTKNMINSLMKRQAKAKIYVNSKRSH